MNLVDLLNKALLTVIVNDKISHGYFLFFWPLLVDPGFDRSGIHVPGGDGSDDMSAYRVDGGDGFAQLSGQEMRANVMRQAERGTVCLDRAEFPAWLGCKNKTTLNVR